MAMAPRVLGDLAQDVMHRPAVAQFRR
jgi:hypothetical protein